MLMLHKKGLSVFLFFIVFLCYVTDGYDPLDISGNVTIQWDIIHENPSGYDADVTIFNYQQYRHIEWPPGWRIGWDWAQGEVIYSMQGAEAKEQGVCNKTSAAVLPHCCLKTPAIIDLQPGAPLNKQATNCCRGGVLTSMAQDESKSMSHFQMSVGLTGSNPNMTMPENFTLATPGYTCGAAQQIFPPTTKPEDNGRRSTQAIRTYRVICTYSQFRAAPSPQCCVSLSAFYSKTITLCPDCSCGCRSQPRGSSCVKKGQTPPPTPVSKDPDYVPPPLVNCTAHLCPIHVHWHIKQSYKQYWRVKITVMNLNVRKNYTSWNLAIEHPNLSHMVESFSFNYKAITLDRPTNDTGVFWGVQSFNDVLMQSGENGNVQSEMLLEKVPGQFSFEAGWAFPKRVVFNGENCVMPHPDKYPRLPNEE